MTTTLLQPASAVLLASTHRLARTRTLLPTWLDALTVLWDMPTMTDRPHLVPCACWASMLVVRRRHVHRVQLASTMTISTRWYRRQAPRV